MQQPFGPARHRIGNALCVLLGLFAVATAASHDVAPQSPVNDGSVLDEIVVTAQKREKVAQDVPISMSVFTDVDLAALHLTNVAELARYAPNLEWDTSFLGAANSSSIFIRGVGQAANFAEHSSDPGVGVYLDGVYIGRGVGSALGILDISQVEVLRGPQGTLFGKNATGGAVTLVSTRPTADFSGWADATGESGSDLDTQAVTAIVDWQPGELTFTSITAYRDMDSQWAMDVDLSPLTIIEDIIGLDQDQFSQEFNLRGRYGSLDWLVGLYYFNEEASSIGGAIIVPEVATVEFDPRFGVPNPLFGVPLNTPGVGPGNTPLVNDHRARSVAVFTHLEYGFNERLSGFAGLRYTSE